MAKVPLIVIAILQIQAGLGWLYDQWRLGKKWEQTYGCCTRNTKQA
jgi:hypothetical protein